MIQTQKTAAVAFFEFLERRFDFVQARTAAGLGEPFEFGAQLGMEIAQKPTEHRRYLMSPWGLGKAWTLCVRDYYGNVTPGSIVP